MRRFRDRGGDDLDCIPGQARDDDAGETPLAAIVCYRALVQSGQTEPVEALANMSVSKLRS